MIEISKLVRTLFVFTLLGISHYVEAQKNVLRISYKPEEPSIDFLTYSFEHRTNFFQLSNDKIILQSQNKRNAKIFMLRKGNIHMDTVQYKAPLRFCMDVYSFFRVADDRMSICSFTNSAILDFTENNIEVIVENEYKKSDFKGLKKKYNLDSKPYTVVPIDEETVMSMGDSEVLFIKGEQSLQIKLDSFSILPITWGVSYNNYFNYINKNRFHMWVPEINRLIVININELDYKVIEMLPLENLETDMNQYFFDRHTNKHYLYRFSSTDKAKCVLFEINLTKNSYVPITTIPYAYKLQGISNDQLVIEGRFDDVWAHYLVPLSGEYEKVNVLEGVDVDN